MFESVQFFLAKSHQFAASQLTIAQIIESLGNDGLVELVVAHVAAVFDEQLEAAEMDGASALSRFRYIILPHMTRAITVVNLIQTIFLLGIFGEIFTTTQGGPGSASTTLPYMIFKQAIAAKDIGRAAAGGIIAVILANIVAYFLMRGIGRHLDT